MSQEFNLALQFTLEWEGGWSRHPADPGGATMRGITQRLYDSWRTRKGLPTRTVAEISDQEIQQIYWEIWMQGADRVVSQAPRTAVAIFDLFVQSGNSGGTQIIQRALGNLTVDGVWGPKTQARLEQLIREEGDLALAVRLVSERVIFRSEIVSRHPERMAFLRGWLRRDSALLRLVTTRALPTR